MSGLETEAQSGAHGAPDALGRLWEGQPAEGRGCARASWMSAERKGQVGPAEAQEGEKQDGPGSPPGGPGEDTQARRGELLRTASPSPLPSVLSTCLPG